MEIDPFRRGGRIGLQAAEANPPRHRSVHGVEHDERHPEGVLRQDFLSAAPGRCIRVRLRCPRCQVAHGAHAALAQHAPGGLDAGDEDAADAVILLADRAVREGEVALLGEAVPAERKHQIVRVHRAARFHDAAEHRSDHVADFHPAFEQRLAERIGVLRAKDRDVAVVVEHDQLGSPAHQHGETRFDADARCRPKALRPPFRGPQRGGGPILGADPRCHLAGDGADVELQIFRHSYRGRQERRLPQQRGTGVVKERTIHATFTPIGARWPDPP